MSNIQEIANKHADKRVVELLKFLIHKLDRELTKDEAMIAVNAFTAGVDAGCGAMQEMFKNKE